MWLNQVANNLPDDPDVVDVLVRAFTDAVVGGGGPARFAEVERVTRDLASKGQPAVGRIPYVLSVFWSTAMTCRDGPCSGRAPGDRMLDLGWVSSWSSADRYAALLETVADLLPRATGTGSSECCGS